jgi:DNA invertase Pin-like site-specific DNA recombinase
MLSAATKVTSDHLRRGAYLYVRQSSLHQVQENRESTARQYDLRRRAEALGWTAEQITVIDEDLGLSGASAIARSGFQRLVADVGLARVGVVMGLEVSRLARNSTDWHRLLEICALANTLILDEDGIYDPSHFNDRLLLGLHGMMSEAELHVLRARLLGGQLNKAKRGELWMRPPIGYVYDEAQRLMLDPDVQIQSTVRALLETFRRTESAYQVVQRFAADGIRWPRRISQGSRAGEVVWASVTHDRVLKLLHNPRYTGAFVYGQTRPRVRTVGPRGRSNRLPREEWKVFIPNAFPGYITWDEFERNQAVLQANASKYGRDRSRGSAREGAALCQGLVVCGRCGQRMTVRYSMARGRAVHEYICQRGIQTGHPSCQRIRGVGIDEAVSRVMLEAVTPAALDVALEVCEELQARKTEVDRLRRAHVARAREEAELAQRQFLLVRPEHRLVADTLERHWNEKLATLRQAEDEYARLTTDVGPDLRVDARERIHALVTDLPRVWHDPHTPARERKRVLRLLVDDITLVRDSVIHLHVRWKGGASTSLECALPRRAPDLRRTPSAIVNQIRELATQQTDHAIAELLNTSQLRSGTGQTFTGRIVLYIRLGYEIPSFAQHLCRAGWLTSAEIAAKLGVRRVTVIRFARAGILRAARVDDKGRLLFEPPTDPLPKPQPGKRLRDRCRYPQCAPHKRKEV